jgi:hypothetical protein
MSTETEFRTRLEQRRDWRVKACTNALQDTALAKATVFLADLSRIVADYAIPKCVDARPGDLQHHGMAKAVCDRCSGTLCYACAMEHTVLCQPHQTVLCLACETLCRETCRGCGRSISTCQACTERRPKCQKNGQPVFLCDACSTGDLLRCFRCAVRVCPCCIDRHEAQHVRKRCREEEDPLEVTSEGASQSGSDSWDAQSYQ